MAGGSCSESVAGVSRDGLSAHPGLLAMRRKRRWLIYDGRHGHSYKVTESVHVWLVEVCRRDPQISSSRIPAALKTTFGGEVSVGHINRVRAQYGVTKPGRGRARTPAKKNCMSRNPSSKKGLGACGCLWQPNTLDC
jgi:transposase